MFKSNLNYVVKCKFKTFIVYIIIIISFCKIITNNFIIIVWNIFLYVQLIYDICFKWER